MKKLFLLLHTTLAIAAVDPLQIKAKVESVYLSRSPYCTSLTQAFDTYYPEFMNFLIQPVLGTLDNTQNTYDGSYSCLVFKMSDRMYFRPASSTSGCTFDTEYTTDICTSGTTTGADGAITNCSSSEDTVFLYLSTASTSTTSGTGNPFTAPTSLDATAGIQLASPLVISGGTGGRFVINGSDKVTSTGPGNCTLDFPAFSFVND